MQFEAAVLTNHASPLALELVDMGTLRADEVLVELVGAGVCHTDLTVQKGHYPVPLPVVLGHEGSGIVKALGDKVTELAVGDHVALTFMSCGRCASCDDGHPAYCREFGPLNISGCRGDGTSAICLEGKPVGGHFFGQSSFARYAIANRRNAVKVRADAPLELLGPFGCGVQTGAGAILNSLRPSAGDSCVIFGGGGVGLSALMAAKVAGCAPLIVVEPNPARRELARELGATHLVDPAEGGIADLIRELTGGGAKAIVETVGKAEIVSDAISALGLGGKLALIGMHDLAAVASFSIVELLNKGASIQGIIEGDSNPPEFIPYLVDLYMDGRFPIDRLVEYYPFADINRALEEQASGSVIKAILRF